MTSLPCSSTILALADTLRIDIIRELHGIHGLIYSAQDMGFRGFTANGVFCMSYAFKGSLHDEIEFEFHQPLWSRLGNLNSICHRLRRQVSIF